MANPEHLAKLKKEGVEAWNKWRKLNPSIKVDLSAADLAEEDLSGADLSGADLIKADLGLANLRNAHLSGANLREADLGEANLSGADLSGALLLFARLIDTVLGAVNLAESEMGYTLIVGVDLSLAIGLETVRHGFPSTISIDTIYRSKGNIPDVFLRRAGVPEPFITNMKALVAEMEPIQFYSCFISYSTEDQKFADRLYADLQTKGVRCWFAPHDIKGGGKIHEQIDEAIRVHDKLLLILSEHSMVSGWVGTEIAYAREREAREKKQMLFPITIAPFEKVKKWKLFDAERGKDSAREIREYYIPDFSAWERDRAGYQREFKKLVAALTPDAALM